MARLTDFHRQQAQHSGLAQPAQQRRQPTALSPAPQPLIAGPACPPPPRIRPRDGLESEPGRACVRTAHAFPGVARTLRPCLGLFKAVATSRSG
jgi:hypothetical protein